MRMLRWGGHDDAAGSSRCSGDDDDIGVVSDGIIAVGMKCGGGGLLKLVSNGRTS